MLSSALHDEMWCAGQPLPPQGREREQHPPHREGGGEAGRLRHLMPGEITTWA